MMIIWLYMYIYIESSCCTLETNITLHVNYMTTEINYNISLRLITTYIIYLIIHCKKKTLKLLLELIKKELLFYQYS